MDTSPFSVSSYVISIWIERAVPDALIWRGVLITSAGQRLHFSTLAQLNGWLFELTGWRDPSQAENNPPS